MNDEARLVVNFARLFETSAHIEAAVTTLESQLDLLEREAAPLVQAWSGEAMQAYQQRQATWRQASADLTSTLRQIKRALDESIADYASTERHNADLFR
jgi:6 kDa early secretory antigenic target